MGGKITLATAIVVPFKEKIGEIVPPVKGELRAREESAAAAANRSAVPTAPTTNVRGAPGGFGDGSGGPPFPLEKELSIEDIMAVVGPSQADAAGGGGDGGTDLESGCEARAAPRSKTGGPADSQEGEEGAARRASGSGRLSMTGGAIRSNDDDGDVKGEPFSRGFALQTVEEGGAGQQAGGSCGDDDADDEGRTTCTPPGCKEGKYEEDELQTSAECTSFSGGDVKSENLAPSHGGL